MECGAHVGKGFVTYPCTLDKGHVGPCMAIENTPSVRQRRAWEEEHHPVQAPQHLGNEVSTAVLAPPEVDLVISLDAVGSDTLYAARETLLEAAHEIEKLISGRDAITKLLDEIEAALPDTAVDGRSAASMLRAMLRA